MSHELRTPLDAMIGYSEMLQEELEDRGDKALAPDLQKIQAAAKHPLGLVNDILDSSKIEVGKMTLFIEEFDVATLVNEVASTAQPLIANNTNQLIVECAPNIGSMRADQTKVRRVVRVSRGEQNRRGFVVSKTGNPPQKVECFTPTASL